MGRYNMRARDAHLCLLLALGSLVGHAEAAAKPGDDEERLLIFDISGFASTGAGRSEVLPGTIVSSDEAQKIVSIGFEGAIPYSGRVRDPRQQYSIPPVSCRNSAESARQVYEHVCATGAQIVHFDINETWPLPNQLRLGLLDKTRGPAMVVAKTAELWRAGHDTPLYFRGHSDGTYVVGAALDMLLKSHPRDAVRILPEVVIAESPREHYATWAYRARRMPGTRFVFVTSDFDFPRADLQTPCALAPWLMLPNLGFGRAPSSNWLNINICHPYAIVDPVTAHGEVWSYDRTYEDIHVRGYLGGEQVDVHLHNVKLGDVVHSVTSPKASLSKLRADVSPRGQMPDADAEIEPIQTRPADEAQDPNDLPESGGDGPDDPNEPPPQGGPSPRLTMPSRNQTRDPDDSGGPDDPNEMHGQSDASESPAPPTTPPNGRRAPDDAGPLPAVRSRIGKTESPGQPSRASEQSHAQKQYPPSHSFSGPDPRPSIPVAASRIGGVLLCNTARVAGPAGGAVDGAAIDPVTGGFCLLVKGEEVSLRDSDLRKFVTALWAVYFGREDPGISIDPVWEPGGDGEQQMADVQLVRVIGNIAETQMANVLLDADYYMKRCAVGILDPGIPGFQSVDVLTGQTGVRIAGASRRFWFVPEDMSFRRCGDALLFDGGRMTLRTTYADLDDAATQREPADEAFARFWTEHYWEFAAANPIYAELYEYARLTALAKYLKQSGANLQWFLLANRDLVLGGTIPGTVPTLRARSRTLRGTHWIGGVNLAVNMSPDEPGRYVLDESSAKVLQDALARQTRTAEDAGTARPDHSTLVRQSFRVALPEGAYTVVPAQSVSGGSGPGGATYHTDMALRHDGEPGVELIRYNKAGGVSGELGRCWDFYRPYALRMAGAKRVRVADVPVLTADNQIAKTDLYVPGELEVVDRVTGGVEQLRFDEHRYDTIAWVPTNEDQSRLQGLTCLTDGSYLLAEKGGCRFRFDAVGRLTDLLFSPERQVQYEYDEERVIAVGDGDGGRIELSHDQYGRVVRAEAGSAFAAYTYGSNNELALVKYSDGRRLVLIYNPDGSLSEAICKTPAAAATEGPESAARWTTLARRPRSAGD